MDEYQYISTVVFVSPHNSGHTECCKWLVANRTPMDALDNMGRTALDLAEEYQHQEIEEFLKSCKTELTRSTSSLSQLRSRLVIGYAKWKTNLFVRQLCPLVFIVVLTIVKLWPISWLLPILQRPRRDKLQATERYIS